MRRPVIAVVGGGGGTVPKGSPTYRLAEALGKLIAQSGAILLCGGGGGVMEAAAIAAKNAGGHTIGIMPGQKDPNVGIEHAVFTSLGDGRNFLNAAVPDAMIALYGEAGTLSEIGLALKMGTPLVYLAAWKFLEDNGLKAQAYVTTPEEAVAEAFKALGIERGQRLDRPLNAPVVRDQTENLAQLASFVARW
jgi:uncharacterized protein (TIGR00725 family)